MMIDYPRSFIHLELSTKCALKCPRCPRTEMEGMYKIDEVSLDFIKNTFSQIANEIEQIHICGGQGDPIYNSNFLEIIRYLKGLPNNPYIKIITNGSYKSKEWWKELSSILNSRDIVVFSVDGWDNESNNMYRVGSDFDSIMTGMKVMVDSQAMVRWATILFKFNQDKIETIKGLAEDIGVEHFDITKSSLFGSKFFGYKDDELGYDPLEPDEKYTSEYGGRFSRYTLKLKPTGQYERPPSTQEAFDKKKEQYKDSYIIPVCKCGGLFYIDVEGVFYPCSWVSHPFHLKKGLYSGRRILWKDNFWLKYKDELNLHTHTFDEIFNSRVWKILESSWGSLDKCFLECENKCLNDNVDYQKLIKKKWRNR
ncbi:MAG: radical SAM protein [Candidatus Heimdallarchaeaceae archaeon]